MVRHCEEFRERETAAATNLLPYRGPRPYHCGQETAAGMPMKYDHQSLSKDIPVKDVIAWLKDAIAWLVKRRWTAFLLGLAPSSLALLMLPAVPNSIGS